MGLFLSMSGVIGAKRGEVEEAFRRYAAAYGGSFSREALTTDDDDCLVISENAGGASVLYPADFLDWDDASEFLSLQLKKPVFSLHIHDEDLWMYVLFKDGEMIDQFNPIPDYWRELDDRERQKWNGNAAVVAQCVPGLSAAQVANYLVRWDDEIFGSDDRKKAYPTDEYFYGSDWQLVDFMKKLGLDYPLGEGGEPRGDTYRFAGET